MINLKSKQIQLPIKIQGYEYKMCLISKSSKICILYFEIQKQLSLCIWNLQSQQLQFINETIQDPFLFIFSASEQFLFNQKEKLIIDIVTGKTTRNIFQFYEFIIYGNERFQFIGRNNQDLIVDLFNDPFNLFVLKRIKLPVFYQIDYTIYGLSPFYFTLIEAQNKYLRLLNINGKSQFFYYKVQNIEIGVRKYFLYYCDREKLKIRLNINYQKDILNHYLSNFPEEVIIYNNKIWLYTSTQLDQPEQQQNNLEIYKITKQIIIPMTNKQCIQHFQISIPNDQSYLMDELMNYYFWNSNQNCLEFYQTQIS